LREGAGCSAREGEGHLLREGEAVHGGRKEPIERTRLFVEVARSPFVERGGHSVEREEPVCCSSMEGGGCSLRKGGDHFIEGRRPSAKRGGSPSAKRGEAIH